ncbi:MAG: acyl-CoA carboxylase subunit epsilon [Micrococcales bacterium]|nr:acyl-CoA carboxylase subunit epsilon [Actinomycetota bacterium]NCA07412.1 acyl-CoA carboxylase subunit epsilon [Micrococcales bacterium]
MIPKESISEGLRVVSGNPTEAELAAVIAILQASHEEGLIAAKQNFKKSTSSWTGNTSNLRSNLRPGVGQWRAQYRPGLD